MSAEFNPRETEESVDIALKVVQTPGGPKVLTQWYQLRAHIFWQPQDAFNFAENLARAAHKARFPGDKINDDFSYLANQIKARLTDQMRDRMMIRVRTMLVSLANKDPNFVSKQIVDTIFSALDDQGEYKL